MSGTADRVGRRLLVVVPAYQEQDCIADVVAEIVSLGHACLVVDDGSTDRTSERAAAAGAAVVTLPINLGVGGALRCAYRWAIAHGHSTVAQIDGDGQHPADQLARLVDELERRDLDLVIGSRFATPDPSYDIGRVRRAAIRLLARVVGTVDGGDRLTDPTSGLRVVRSPLLEAWAADFPPHYLGDTFEAVLIARRRGYRIAEVAVTMRPRQGGVPSAGWYASSMAVVRAVTVLFTGTTFDLPPRPTDRPPARPG